MNVTVFIVVFCVGLYIQQIAFPQVHYVSHVIGITCETVPQMSMKRTGIDVVDRLFLLLCARLRCNFLRATAAAVAEITFRSVEKTDGLAGSYYKLLVRVVFFNTLTTYDVTLIRHTVLSVSQRGAQ